MPSFDFLADVDIFQAELPAFNWRGRQSYGSVFGGATSIAILYVTFLFSASRLVHLFKRQDTLVNTYTNRDEFTDEDRFSVKEGRFQMAFALENWFKGETLSDEKYLKWFANYREKSLFDGVDTSRELPIYECTEKDYERFYPIDKRSENQFRKFKDDPKYQLLCIDWEESGVDFYGLESTGKLGTVEINIVPCNLKLTTKFLGGLDDRISDNCVANLT